MLILGYLKYLEARFASYSEIITPILLIKHIFNLNAGSVVGPFIATFFFCAGTYVPLHNCTGNHNVCLCELDYK